MTCWQASGQVRAAKPLRAKFRPLSACVNALVTFRTAVRYQIGAKQTLVGSVFSCDNMLNRLAVPFVKTPLGWRPGSDDVDVLTAAREACVHEMIAGLADGYETHIRLSACAQIGLREATGQIHDISADALQADRTGAEFYLARITLEARQASHIEDLQRQAGMPFDFFILAGERTAFSCSEKPLSVSLENTFIGSSCSEAIRDRIGKLDKMSTFQTK